jgi:hypothetical protein
VRASRLISLILLLRLGPEVEVLDPPELRDRMTETAARLAALYGPQRQPITGAARSQR